VTAAAVVGSLRRRREIVRDINLLCASTAPERPLAALADLPAVTAVERRDAGRCVARLAGGPTVTLEVVAPARYPAALVAATGSAAHVARLAMRAAARGEGTAELPAAADEAGVYAALGLPFVPPELREEGDEVDAAAAGDDFGDLVTESDVRGLVHCHTVYSDGRHTVEEMARAAEALGAEYLTITDHSPSAAYAGGVGLDRLHRQWEEIARAQEQVKVRLLRGTESDILADGSLDYPDDVLASLDVVIASIHVRHKMDPAAMTERLVRAMRHPLFKIWGHALGRLLLRRDPIACDVERVLDAIAGARAAIEVNGDPHRLDLEPRWIRAARARGIKFVISTDAHSTRELGNVRFGVAMARRAGLRRSDVLNTADAAAFAAAVRPAA
jgi:DNA polymerase (family 10)